MSDSFDGTIIYLKPSIQPALEYLISNLLPIPLTPTDFAYMTYPEDKHGFSSTVKIRIKDEERLSILSTSRRDLPRNLKYYEIEVLYGSTGRSRIMQEHYDLHEGRSRTIARGVQMELATHFDTILESFES